MTLSVVLPCYNEEENVERTVRDVAAWFDTAKITGEIIAVNDGSKDGTRSMLERLTKTEPRLVVVNHEVNQGYGAAIRSGCDIAAKEYIAFMDSDQQFHASDIGKLLPLLKKAPFVTGIRIKRADPFIRRLNSKMYGLLTRLVLGIKPTDLNCGMKVFAKALWPHIRPAHATGALFNAEVFYALKQQNLPYREVPVPHYPREKGQPTGAKLSVILRMFSELLELKRARANPGSVFVWQGQTEEA